MIPLAWRLIAITSLLLAMIGVLLPVMPTVPFLLLAAWAANRGWPELHDWLLDHPIYGPPLHDWHHYRAVSRRAKIAATVAMLGSILITSFAPVPLWLKYTIASILMMTGIWLWLRPER